MPFGRATALAGLSSATTLMLAASDALASGYGVQLRGDLSGEVDSRAEILSLQIRLSF